MALNGVYSVLFFIIGVHPKTTLTIASHFLQLYTLKQTYSSAHKNKVTGRPV